MKYIIFGMLAICVAALMSRRSIESFPMEHAIVAPIRHTEAPVAPADSNKKQSTEITITAQKFGFSVH